MMNISKKLFTSVFFLFIGLIFSQNNNIEVYDLKNQEPYNFLGVNDTLKLPYEVYINLTNVGIRDLTFKSNYFFSRFNANTYTKNDTIYVSQNKDTLDINMMYNVGLMYEESDKTYVAGLPYRYEKIDDSTKYFSTGAYYENQFYHKWDLRNYPFDSQRLRYEFITYQDTSIVFVKETEFAKSELDENIEIIDGWEFKGFDYESSFFENPSLDKVKTNMGERSGVSQRFYVILNLERDGLFLYFKLFFGTFLSFIISYLVFFIDKKYFETRITLSIGGIFGAVGNRYFVESIMPEVQILTKGDLINNLVIFLIVMNIFIVILQNRKIKNKFISDNSYPAIFSFITFILLNMIIIFM